MRELANDQKVTFRSDWQVTSALDRVVSLAGRRVKFRGHKLTKEAVLNAAILALEALPLEELERVLTAQVARLEAILTAEESPLPPASGPPPGPSGAAEEILDRPRGRRRKDAG